jgi:EAL domain-containing protein (putative c-di-GMP-specific phosphodiesterase class I)/ActR/RegA family two-component response regulator
MSARPLPISDGKPRLLILDDDRLQRMLISQIAQQSGFDVDDAGSVREARELLETNVYRTAVVDLSLADGDGLQIFRMIAGNPMRPAILLVSGLEERVLEGAVRVARQLGLATHGALRKPLDLFALRRSLLAEVQPTEHAADPPAIAGLRRSELLSAIRRRAIAPVYQPKVSLDTGRMTGVEALARWRSPTHGVIRPDVFIPLAERWGLIGELTESMLAQACEDAVRWKSAGQSLSLAVNVPASALSAPEFPDRAEAIAAEAGLPMRKLTIEMTESVAMSDAIQAGDVLTRLRIKGAQLSIDDFGTGFSSMLSLLSMPFGELKMDRSFVHACDRDRYAWKIVRATLSLAREFSMNTVAEGVETETVNHMLADAGCETGQGFLYGRPMGADAVTEILRRETAVAAGLSHLGPDEIEPPSDMD